MWLEKRNWRPTNEKRHKHPTHGLNKITHFFNLIMSNRCAHSTDRVQCMEYYVCMYLCTHKIIHQSQKEIKRSNIGKNEHITTQAKPCVKHGLEFCNLRTGTIELQNKSHLDHNKNVLCN